MINYEAYENIKKEQITQYRRQAGKFHAQGQFLLVPIVMGYLWMASVFLILAYLEETFALSTYTTIAMLLSVPAVGLIETVLYRLRSNAIKSSILLNQLSLAVERVLSNKGKAEAKRQQIVDIEARFLANDDELFTKKYIWKHYLNHVNAKATNVEQGGDGKIHPRRMELPAVWRNGEALKSNDYSQRNIILPAAAIKRKLRELRSLTLTYRGKHDILVELDKLANINATVFERFLRNKKISKYLKEFKRAARIFYLSPAAKMRLIDFVNDIISERPYQSKTPEGTELLAYKNEQIAQYSADFWRVHRRSLRFYFFEAIWLAWLLPFGLFALHLLRNNQLLSAALVFFTGAAIVVYGEMMLVTRQMIDLKGKKLMPPLIASLIAIRHSMCCSAGDTESAEKYARYYKNVEKHFILTTNEIESVKYVQENLKEKKQRLTQGVTALCEQKKSQLQQYYQEFRRYRQRCMLFGCAEAFVGLLFIPVWGLSFWLGARFNMEDIELFLQIGYGIIALITEFILIRRHIFAWRYKEMYLLIYQELAVTLVDPDMIDNEEKLRAVFTNSEQEAVAAANLDNMHEIPRFIQNLTAQRI